MTRCDLRLYAADNSDINLLGIIPVIITDVVTGHYTRQIVYICRRASSLLLSLEACEDLGYISQDFPSSHYGTSSNAATLAAGKKPDCDCKCPVRETAPDAPTELPFEPTYGIAHSLAQGSLSSAFPITSRELQK